MDLSSLTIRTTSCRAGKPFNRGTSLGRACRLLLGVATVGGLLAAVPAATSAASCPGTTNAGWDDRAYAASIGVPPGPLYGLLSMDTCTVMKFGLSPLQPNDCITFHSSVSPSSRDASVEGTWPSSAARLAAGDDAGCELNCGAFTCQVRASDGFPVELLGFDVQ